MKEILVPAVIISVIGLVAGILLTLASRFMAVKSNETEKAILKKLPGVNCGACGYPGCEGYAKALASDKNVPINLCVPGGDPASQEIADILGVEFVDVIEKIAFVHCKGTCDRNKDKACYDGISSCVAAKGVFGGKSGCNIGCLGYGDCAAACPVHAIAVKDGVAIIDKCTCIGCGLCATVCPNGIISLYDNSQRIAVTCSNTEKGAAVRKKCSIGCIGCMKCEKVCPAGAVSVKDNLARIDHQKCTNCGECIRACPIGCIDEIF